MRALENYKKLFVLTGSIELHHFCDHLCNQLKDQKTSVTVLLT